MIKDQVKNGSYYGVAEQKKRLNGWRLADELIKFVIQVQDVLRFLLRKRSGDCYGSKEISESY